MPRRRLPTGPDLMRAVLTADGMDIMMPSVRTTVTLDADTERLLRSAMRERNVSFKAALNDAIRRGLRPHAASGAEPRFTTTAKAMHLRAGIDPTRMHDLDAALEVQRFRELTTRLEREQARR